MSQTAHRRLRAAVRLPFGRARQPRRLGRLAVLSPLRQPVGVRAASSTTQAGHWSIHPTADAEVTRRYVDDTMVLETTFRTATGTVASWSTRWPSDGTSAATRSAPKRRRALLRQITGASGETEIVLAYAPRPEYGLVYPLFDPVDGGIHARGGADVLALELAGSARGRRPSRRPHGSRSTRVRRCGSRSSTGRRRRSRPGSGRTDEIGDRLADTAAAWHTWSEIHQAYEGPWRDLVHHSGRVLYALTYFPTGRHLRGADDVAPGDARRLTQLGLPLRVGARRELHDPGAVGRGVSRRGRQVLRLHVGGGRVAGAAGRRPPDHVRHRRRARSQRTRAAPSHRMARQRAGAGRERRVEPAPARRLRRAARRRVPAPRPARRLGAVDPPVPRRPRRHRRGALAGAGPGNLGSARRAARLPVLQAHVLGRARPGDQARRPARRRRSRRRLDTRRATRSPTPSSPAAGTSQSARSPSRSAPRTSTRRT